MVRGLVVGSVDPSTRLYLYPGEDPTLHQLVLNQSRLFVRSKDPVNAGIEKEEKHSGG